MTFNDLGVQKVKQNEFHAFDILLDPSQKRTLKTKPRSMIPVIGSIAAALLVVVGVFYFNASEELIAKKGVISSKPLVFVTSIDSSRLSDDDKKYVEGFVLINNKLIDVLKSNGLNATETIAGDKFDAEIHDAITQIPVEDASQKGKIIDVTEKGYQLGDKIIRFPKVVVGK